MPAQRTALMTAEHRLQPIPKTLTLPNDINELKHQTVVHGVTRAHNIERALHQPEYSLLGAHNVCNPSGIHLQCALDLR